MRITTGFIVGLMLAGGATALGCGGGEEGGGGSSGGGGGGSGGSGASAGSGGASGAGAGGVAPTECTPTNADCYAAGPEGPGHECMAKADFSASDVTELRMTSHQVSSPTALAKPFVQDSIITKKSTLNEPACNLNGLGQFNFLMQVDTAQKQITIGGGVPQALVGDAKSGTCWAVFTDPISSLEIKPETAPYTVNAEGEIEGAFADFVMPIYTDDKFDTESVVLVPLHEVTFTAKLSADKNCVGRYAHETLSMDNLCLPAQGEFAWQPAGRYQGYITVVEADKVMVVSLGETLCVVLSDDPSKWKGTNQDCASSKGFTSTGGLPKGDWCSTTNSAGGCQDSWQLVIDFAAQAIDVKGNYDAAQGGC